MHLTKSPMQALRDVSEYPLPLTAGASLNSVVVLSPLLMVGSSPSCRVDGAGTGAGNGIGRPQPNNGYVALARADANTPCQPVKGKRLDFNRWCGRRSGKHSLRSTHVVETVCTFFFSKTCSNADRDREFTFTSSGVGLPLTMSDDARKKKKNQKQCKYKKTKNGHQQNHMLRRTGASNLQAVRALAWVRDGP